MKIPVFHNDQQSMLPLTYMGSFMGINPASFDLVYNVKLLAGT
jgi:hypothetical protein